MCSSDLTGIQGASGITGDTGATGYTGATGAQGDFGATGYQGVDGASGIDGATGLTGATGPQGETGATGIDGASGLTGATGAAGASGADGDTYSTISTATLSIPIGGATGITVGSNLDYTPGQTIVIAKDASNYQQGTVTSYSGTLLEFIPTTHLGTEIGRAHV